MSALLARLDGHLFSALFHLADLLLELDERYDRIVSDLEDRWNRREIQRTPFITAAPPRRRAAHRLARTAYRRTLRHPLRGVPVRFDKQDYEWGQAIQAMARRMEGSYRWR